MSNDITKGPIINADKIAAEEAAAPDMRMVRCVLGSYTECPALCKAACICSGYPHAEYERLYKAKYGERGDD